MTRFVLARGNEGAHKGRVTEPLPRPALLLYGFEPFGAEPRNPSGEAVMTLDGVTHEDATIAALVLPVAFDDAFVALTDACARHRPRAVLGIGQGGAVFSVETRAQNRIGSVPDNKGVVRTGVIEEAGPEVLEVTLDVERIEGAMRAAIGPDAPYERSHDAGAYLCNYTIYRLLRRVPSFAACGFVHVPRLSHAPQSLTNRAVRAAALELARSVAGASRA